MGGDEMWYVHGRPLLRFTFRHRFCLRRPRAFVVVSFCRGNGWRKSQNLNSFLGPDHTVVFWHRNTRANDEKHSGYFLQSTHLPPQMLSFFIFIFLKSLFSGYLYLLENPPPSSSSLSGNVWSVE